MGEGYALPWAWIPRLPPVWENCASRVPLVALAPDSDAVPIYALVLAAHDLLGARPPPAPRRMWSQAGAMTPASGRTSVGASGTARIPAATRRVCG
jgi:hypothetical protein